MKIYFKQMTLRLSSSLPTGHPLRSIKKISQKLVLALFISTGYLLSANANNIPINSDNFKLEGKEAEFVIYKGETSLLLNGASATVNGLTLTNGTIEYDVAFTEKRNFTGVKFRQQDSNNAEEFYIRPHQSGNPDANQYTPVFNGLAAWQLYHKGFAGRVSYNFDDWNHVKIVITGTSGKIYINDMDKAVFNIKEFLRPIESGAISFYSARENAYIANVSIVKNDEPKTLSPKPRSSELSDSNKLMNYVSKWQVSNSFSKNELGKVAKIGPKQLTKMVWQSLNVDSYGVLNMARAQSVDKTNNTAFAKFSIDSDNAQIKALHFGYSDAVRVYVNNTPIYAGSNGFLSRDYRYLGTIGLFDTIYLPLKAGKNEIKFAVSEQFGGWGVMAKFDNCDGIQPCINK